MAINPYRKGGVDVSVPDGGTGASAAPTGLNNLGHATLDHTGIPGVGAMPAGTLLDFAGTTLPSGWLECDGASYATATEPTLFAAIGYAWGGAGANFNVPDFRRRASVGRGGSGTGTLGNAVGNTGGAETHTLSSGEMPIHNHSDTGNTHSHNLNIGLPGGLNSNTGVGGNAEIALGSGSSSQQAIGGTTSSNSSSIGLTNAGGGGAHNNMQPSAVVMKIIKT